MTINKIIITFFDFIFITIKHCLPLFCEFYATILKTNSGFKKISNDEIISENLHI